MTTQPKPVAPTDHEPFEPMACCGRERDKDGGPNPHCECPAELKPKPVAPEVDLDELSRILERSACTEANQWAYSDVVTYLSPDMLRALIAETRAHRAAKLTPVGVVTRERGEAAFRREYPATSKQMLDEERRGHTSRMFCADQMEEAFVTGYISGAAAKPPAGVEVGEAWIPIGERLPDSDLWVVCVNHEGDYQVVQLEFTDDSEGHSEPYWAGEGGDVALRNYPFWMPLPNPPEAT